MPLLSLPYLISIGIQLYLDDNVMGHIDETLGISVGLRDFYNLENKPKENKPGEMVVTL